MEHVITNITHNIHATVRTLRQMSLYCDPLFKCCDLLQENFVKLVELQRDLVGIDNVVNPNRHFLREGCLQKLSRKGFQQRMFFLVLSLFIIFLLTSAVGNWNLFL